MLSLAFPPVNASLLVLVALAPFLAYLRDTDGRGAKRAGYAFGWLYFAFQMFWLVPFVGKWTGNYVLACVPWLLAASIAGLYYLWAGWLVHRCWQTSMQWAIPIVWAGVEAMRSYIIGIAFPWGIVAEPLGMPFPMAVQHAAWGTIFLVSATVVLLNMLIASVVWPDKKRELAPREAFAYIAVLILVVASSIVRFNSPQDGQVRVYTVAQTGVDQAFSNPETKQQRVQTSVDVIMAFAASQRSETVVFPEGIGDPSPGIPPLSPIRTTPDRSVIFGGNRVEGDDTYQTAYAYDGEWSFANKTRLVIFGEYVPFRDQLSFLKGFDLPSGDLTPAKELKTLDVDGVKTGALLCFEGMFPDLAERHSRNGAQVLVQMSIDDWYAHTWAHEQLTHSSIWRSIESGLPLLRSASMGTTLVTDSRGRITQPIPKFGETTAMRAEVKVPAGSDAFPYRFGFVWLCWLAMAWVHVAAILEKRRKQT